MIAIWIWPSSYSPQRRRQLPQLEAWQWVDSTTSYVVLFYFAAFESQTYGKGAWIQYLFGALRYVCLCQVTGRWSLKPTLWLKLPTVGIDIDRSDGKPWLTSIIFYEDEVKAGPKGRYLELGPQSSYKSTLEYFIALQNGTPTIPS